MKRSIGTWQLAGFAVTALGGTLLHFLYGWLDKAVWVAPFSSVNESTWEHMKLLFWPAFLFAMVQSLSFRDRKDFWCVKLRGILLGLALIPTIYYTYNGAIGPSPDWLNIAIFFIAATAAYLFEAKSFRTGETACRLPMLALGWLCVVAFLLVAFTFAAPELGIFRDPLTGTYGI